MSEAAVGLVSSFSSCFRRLSANCSSLCAFDLHLCRPLSSLITECSFFPSLTYSPRFSPQQGTQSSCHPSPGLCCILTATL